ncbi:unnamed protein product [Ectocarpus sp. CCAP 1310/34]|nr:unnamed protein product [Ectocarpus sp. CCAP 1310/34]
MQADNTKPGQGYRLGHTGGGALSQLPAGEAMPRARYENEGPPAAVSFLLIILGIAALCIAAVYLRASTLHDREIKISAYEETISEWTAFRPTFARLSINVTAHFGVAPVNTTSPGLDPNPPPPGTPLALAVSEDADPIHDEEGDAGGLPNYVPLKLERGVAPPPWRTARRFPPPQENSQEDSQEDSQEGSEEVPDEGSEEEGGQPANEDGGDAAGEARDDEGLVTSGTATSSGDVGGGGSARSGGGERRWRRRLESGGSGRENVRTGDESPAAEAEAPWPLSDVVAEGASVGEGGEQQSRTSGSEGRRRVDALGDEEGNVGEEEGGGEEDDGLAAAATLPPGFIPEAAFDDAPSVRFVFSARLEPAPTSSKGGKKGFQGGDGGANGGRGRLLLLQPEEDGKARWRWRWRRRRETEDGRRRMKKAPAAAAPVLAEMVTEWTPLTRIREEHAPMPAPETKCMQVRL